MYLNFDYAFSKGIKPKHVLALQLIHQNSGGTMEIYLKEIHREVLNDLFVNKLLYFVKGKKDDSSYKKLRLNKKGKDLYRNLTVYKLEKNDEKIYEFLSSAFSELDKRQASKNKILKLIAFFRLESGFTFEEMYKVCKSFVNDTENMKYNNCLEYVFFKPENIYEKPKLENSRLWHYYEKLQRDD